MLAKLIVRIAASGLSKGIRQQYLRAWLAELELIKKETPTEGLEFATSLFWNIASMRKATIKKPSHTKRRRTVGKILLTGSTLAAVLVVLVQWSSPPIHAPSTLAPDQSPNAGVIDPLAQTPAIEEAVEEPTPRVAAPAPPPSAARASSESYAKPPSALENLTEASGEESFPEGSGTRDDLDSEYALNFAQNEPKTSLKIPAEEFSTATSTETAEMELGLASDLEVADQQDSQNIFSMQDEEGKEETFTQEEAFALGESSFGMETEGLHRALSAPEQQEEIALKSLHELAQGYLASKKVSKKEAEEFIEVFSELLSLDEKAAKNYLDNLLKQIR